VEDLEKAQHYVQKLIDLHMSKKRGNKLVDAFVKYVAKSQRRFKKLKTQSPVNNMLLKVAEYCQANSLNSTETEITLRLANWATYDDLLEVKALIQGLIDGANGNRDHRPAPF
jgi:hypothetical protein